MYIVHVALYAFLIVKIYDIKSSDLGEVNNGYIGTLRYTYFAFTKFITSNPVIWEKQYFHRGTLSTKCISHSESLQTDRKTQNNNKDQRYILFSKLP